MKKVAVQMFVSLDGVMEAPENWTMRFWSDDHAKYAHDQLLASDALLLGRVTYQHLAAASPSRTGDDLADRMNDLPKYVVSRTLDKPEWNAILLDGNVEDEVVELKQMAGKDILVYGSAQLVNELVRHDLIDDFRIWVFPVVLGSGKRLFEDGLDAALRLVDATTFESGVVVLRYEPSGRARPASSAREPRRPGR
jgi:dihydrofolate reductase